LLSLDPPTIGPSRHVASLFDESGERPSACGRFTAVRLCSAKHPHFAAAAETLARAFCGSEKTNPDPATGWVYSGTCDSLLAPLPGPPSEKRLQWFRWLTRMAMHWALQRGGAYALLDRAEGVVVAVTLVSPPGAPSVDELGFCGELGLICKAGLPPFSTDSERTGAEFGSCMDRMRTLETTLVKAHNELEAEAAGSGKSGDLHVAMVAADPQRQGQGVGSALLQLVSDIADADAVSAHLETLGERNEGFYAKKGGYRLAKRVVVQHKNCRLDLDGGIALMVRPAKCRAESS